MGAISLDSLIVLSSSAAWFSRIAALALLQVALCCGESITGVVWSNSVGPSADASGTIELATGTQMHTIYYGSSTLEKHFTADSCLEIGAIWVVEVQSLPDSSLTARSAACDGRSDRDIRGAWLVVREYFATLDKQPSESPGLLSSRWRSSSEARAYEKKIEGLDLKGYRLFGSAMCIGVTEMRRPGVIRLRAGADCHLMISGVPVDLVFTVQQLDKGERWEIDRVEVH
jgi:hypothetical protein